jgi:hypothetical protein
MNSAMEIACTFLLIGCGLVGAVFAHRIHLVDCYIRKHHPGIVDEITGLSIGARLRSLFDAVVFPRRRLRAELAAGDIEDPRLEALISSTVFRNREYCLPVSPTEPGR